MKGSICVLAEQWRGRISETTYEALALGREVADELGVPLTAILTGWNARDLALTLGAADSVLYVDHPLLAEPVPQPWAAALAQVVAERRPRALLVPLTNVSLGVSTLLAVDLGVAAVNFCKDVKVAGGRLRALCVMYGGKIEATVEVGGEPAILCLWPGTRPADKGRADRSPSIEQTTVTLQDCAVRLKRYIDPETGDVDLTKQDVLVAVGRGIQSKDNIALAEDLAKALGGAVAGSRPVIDQGWLPLARQVGKSGLTVKPKLYVALGISGAPEHIEGMKDSGLIVAINSDARAPIFNVAHYGIVADVVEALPLLTASIEAKRTVSHHA
ncbi:MAG: electron transfer flavoprotein subunit alpha/FixB family protein [Candidatus Solibacter sp.]